MLAGEGWHPGVVGIAASRMVERTGRPSILLSIDPNGRARGSGRSIPGFDLLAALEQCAPLLDRFGGHKAAAGVELDAAKVDEFARAFAAAAATQLPEGLPKPPARIDAVVGPEALDTRVAEQLETLGPFGEGNPAVRLLVPWARAEDVRPMGEDGRHARFSIASGRNRAGAVVFNGASSLEPRGDRSARLHGPARAQPLERLGRAAGRARGPARADGAEPRRRGRRPAPAPAAPAPTSPGGSASTRTSRSPGDELDVAPAAAGGPAQTGAGEGRRVISHSGRSAVALAGELLSSGSRVLIVTADARRRSRLAALAAGPSRFGGTHAVVCGSCGSDAALAAAAAPAEGGADLLLVDWEALVADPAIGAGFAARDLRRPADRRGAAAGARRRRRGLAARDLRPRRPRRALLVRALGAARRPWPRSTAARSRRRWPARPSERC